MPEKKRNPFKLREFRGIHPDFIAALETLRIKNADQMLTAGRTRQQRSTLARDTGIPEDAILELVKLSDLARLPGVKGIRARLYYDAGVDSVEEMTHWDPEALRIMVTKFVEQTGFDGIPPLPKEVSSTIANAKKLPKIIEY
ncbi:MAG: DUF4332 domain-containing protein [Chloroflexota bacterium]